jgi:ferredoxin
VPRVRVEPSGRTFEVPVNANLREALLREEEPLYRGLRALFNCGGKARCGTCAVKVVEGGEHLSPRTPIEAIRAPDPPPGMRLACQVNVRGDCAVDPREKGIG